MKTPEVQGDAWQLADRERFWRQIAREQHIIHTYSSRTDLVNMLFTFVDDGIKSDDAVLVISLPETREPLDEKLQQAGHNIFSLKLRDQYIAIDASEMLAEFMINNAPDPLLFRYTMVDLTKRAKRSQRRVRAVSEMAAVLWSGGNQEAALALEHLWNDYLDMAPFTLLCAHPDAGTAGVGIFEQVHRAHRRCVVAHQESQQTVMFRSA